MSYKKWVYKYKYLKTEESEFAEKMEIYKIKFNEDFITAEAPPSPNPPPKQPTSIEENIEENIKETLESKPQKKGKDLYKELVKEFHPDKGGTEKMILKIRKSNSMYEDENVLGMYVKAEELGIEIEVLDEDGLEETFAKYLQFPSIKN